MSKDVIVKYIGQVEELNYSESDENPRLRIKPIGSCIQECSDGFFIPNDDLMKAIRRTLTTGDIIECTINDDINRIGILMFCFDLQKQIDS